MSNLLQSLRDWWGKFTACGAIVVPNPWAGTPFDSGYVPEPIKPLYFVMHPDGSYSAADPQPPLYPEEWTDARKTEQQLRFLLNQAPMLNAPDDLRSAAHAVTAFAYIHPKTAAKYGNVDGRKSFHIPPSPTEWVLTELMPEGRVVFTPNEMPRSG